MRDIYLDKPNLGSSEKRYLARTIEEGYVSTCGPFISEFEERFGDYLGAGRAVCTQSGTAAIHISLHELGIGKGDEVIVPALTFISTVNPVIYLGASPVFADVDRKSFNITAGTVEKLITKKTKAIIPVHLYGNPCEMDDIMRLAKKHNLRVVEDATESLGAAFNGRNTGTFGEFGCFSFNGNKVITTGGGGMVVGRDKKRLARIKFLVNQARDESRAGYYYPEIGFNYRMTNLEAALGLAQLERLESFLKKKRRFNAIYRDELGDLDFIRFQEEPAGASSSWWLTNIIIEDKINIPSLQSKLRSAGVPTRRIFMPITEFPPYKKFRRQPYRNSYDIYERGLSLPGSTCNSDAGIKYVCRILRKILLSGKNRKRG